MSITLDRSLCTACEACLEACPFDAVEMDGDAARITEACTLCGACEDACPTGAVSIEKKEAAAKGDWSGVWVFAEQRQGALAPVTFELLGAGRRLADRLGASLEAVVFGHRTENLTAQLFGYGADRVYAADHPDLADFSEDLYADLLVGLVRRHRPEIVLCGATSLGRSFFPRAANLLDAGLTADCTGLDIREEDRLLIQTRPAFGGNIMAAIVCPAARPQMATVRPKVMRSSAFEEGRSGEVAAVGLSETGLAPRARVKEFAADLSEQVNLAGADVIVAGGRGLGSAAGFQLLRRLADLLGGAVGASRAVVDDEWIPYAHQVGQTGKTVSPRLYIACGISGAVQHLVGMQSADVIAAVNSDPQAPIFDAADYALVGDLYEIVPAIIEELEKSSS